jgi:hypothetical protein
VTPPQVKHIVREPEQDGSADAKHKLYIDPTNLYVPNVIQPNQSSQKRKQANVRKRVSKEEMTASAKPHGDNKC